jgi:hypothetical protein
MATNIALSAPPTLTEIFPPGGRRGSTIRATVKGKFDRWPVTVLAADSCGDEAPIRVTANATKGLLDIEVPEDCPVGVYWIRLHTEDGISTARPFVVGCLAEHVESAESTKGQLLPTSRSVVNGRLRKGGEVDVYFVDLRAGETLVADVLAQRILGSPMDASLQIVSPDGFVLADNDDDQGLDPRIVFAATEAGRYGARIFAFPSTPNSTIGFAGAENFVYRLTLTTGAFVDHSHPLCVSRNAIGEVELIGWNIPEDSRRVRLVPQSNGHARVATDSRTANLRALPIIDRPSRIESSIAADATRELNWPVTVSGRIANPGEIDRYTLTMKKDERLRLRVTARQRGSLLDPVLRVLDATGKQLVRTDDSGGGMDCETVFAAPADGQFRVEVRDLFAHGGMRHVYQLDVLRPMPDFRLEIAVTELVLSPGKRTELSVTVHRVDGFSGEIEVAVADAPPGVRVASVRSMNGKATAKAVKLSFDAEFGPLVSPIRIVGTTRTSDGKQSTRQAEIRLPGVPQPSRKLWVSVGAPVDERLDGREKKSAK